MRHLMSGITVALCWMSIAVAANEAPERLTCADPPTILSIAPHASFAEIGKSDAISMYEVKYQHCEQIHRVLIQVPSNHAGATRSRFHPIFF